MQMNIQVSDSSTVRPQVVPITTDAVTDNQWDIIGTHLDAARNAFRRFVNKKDEEVFKAIQPLFSWHLTRFGGLAIHNRYTSVTEPKTMVEQILSR